jgi:hypothetical protein
MSESEAEQPPALTDRVIASFNTYSGMVEAMRARAQERRIAITSSEVAALANLPEYYLAKLLSVHPVRRVGMISFAPLCSVLGIKMLMVEDKEMIARMERLAIQKFGHPLQPRNEACVHNGAAIEFKFSRRHMQKIGKNGSKLRWARARMLAETASIIAPLGAAARHAALSPRRRSQIARKAARARWRKVREAEAAVEAATAEAKAAAKEAAKAAKASQKGEGGITDDSKA